MEGRKDDQGKARFDLMPPAAITALARLFTTGAGVYGDRNWEAGMAWGRVFGAMMRHAWTWLAGEMFDRKDGQHHLISVAWCALVLYEFQRRGAGTDDRSSYDVQAALAEEWERVERERERAERARIDRTINAWAEAARPQRDTARDPSRDPGEA